MSFASGHFLSMELPTILDMEHHLVLLHAQRSFPLEQLRFAELSQCSWCGGSGRLESTGKERFLQMV